MTSTSNSYSNGSAQAVLDIFRELNNVPRPSHHEEQAADWLCRFAQRHGLDYSRDAQNCVVIRKPASPGYEHKEPLVILNHMDMVCVANPGVEFNPLTSPVEAYEDQGWLKARGTSLGADNGLGLSMALAVLQDDTLPHPALEVLTTTNEEDGMSGAAGLSPDFISGRKVLNLDSEDYDTITVGAAGACLQQHRLPLRTLPAPEGLLFCTLRLAGGLGGHSGVDINKGRANANHELACLIGQLAQEFPLSIHRMDGGEANASIASAAEAVLGIPSEMKEAFEVKIKQEAVRLQTAYAQTDPGLRLTLEFLSEGQSEQQPEQQLGKPTDGHSGNRPATILHPDDAARIVKALSLIPSGVTNPLGCPADVTPVTSNNLGIVRTESDCLCLSTHTRSFSGQAMDGLSDDICRLLKEHCPGATSTRVMRAPAWREKDGSAYINKVSDTFREVLGFRPRPVEMHFVLEAGYYVDKYPGIEIACIGPRIVCPHSTEERAELSTVENIWKVVKRLLENW